MAKTPSNMIPLGTRAPDFNLLDAVTNKYFSLDELKSPIATVIMFICNHCPYVKHIQPKVSEISKIYQSKGISFIAVNSNDIENYPEDSPENMRKEVIRYNLTFPYLFDETQDIAKAYQAACTPDFYIFDKNLSCVYRGRFDDSTPGNNQPVTGKELLQALDHILAGMPVNPEQTASVGCNIKWKNK